MPRWANRLYPVVQLNQGWANWLFLVIKFNPWLFVVIQLRQCWAKQLFLIVQLGPRRASWLQKNWVGNRQHRRLTQPFTNCEHLQLVRVEVLTTSYSSVSPNYWEWPCLQSDTCQSNASWLQQDSAVRWFTCVVSEPGYGVGCNHGNKISCRVWGGNKITEIQVMVIININMVGIR